MKLEKRETPLSDERVEAFRNSLMNDKHFDHIQVELIGQIYKDYDINVALTYDLAELSESKLNLFTQLDFHDINYVLNSMYNQTQLQIISQSTKDISLDWIEEHLPPSVPYKKMEWILVGISKGYSYFKDNVCYLVTNYRHEQIYEIYAGFESGVDVSIYDSSNIPASVMRTVRFALEQGLDVGKGNQSFNIRW